MNFSNFNIYLALSIIKCCNSITVNVYLLIFYESCHPCCHPCTSFQYFPLQLVKSKAVRQKLIMFLDLIRYKLREKTSLRNFLCNNMIHIYN